MTLAQAGYERFLQLERTYPADLSKHLKDLERLAVKSTIIEDRQEMRTIPALRVRELKFSDGSKLRVELAKKKNGPYRWTGCRVLGWPMPRSG